MSHSETTITLIGNLVSEPELRYTPTGLSVANIRIASTPRRFNRQSNQWEDGEAMFIQCSAWGQAAENLVQSLGKGMRVIAHGRLRQRSFETREGERRSVIEMLIDEIGPSLAFATAKVSRENRQTSESRAHSFNDSSYRPTSERRSGFTADNARATDDPPF